MFIFVLWYWVLLSFYVKHVLNIVGSSNHDVHGYHYSFASCMIPSYHFQICAVGMYGSYVWFGYGIIKMRACWWVWINVYVITMKQPTTPDFNSYLLVMEISYVKSLCLVSTSTVSKLKLWWVSCHVCLFINLACCHSHQSCATSSTIS